MRKRSPLSIELTLWCVVCISLTSQTQELSPFGTVTLKPAFELNGAGSNVDSIAFWEAPNPADSLMFVTGKGNRKLEVWKSPFSGTELPSIPFNSPINGVAVDQRTDRLYVSDRKISVLSLPGLNLLTEFGEGIIGVGENNLGILHLNDGRTRIYVSEDHKVHAFDATTFDHLGSFAPPVSSIETLQGDDFHQRVLVPEEQGIAGNPGIYAYHPDGTPFTKNGTNRFGNEGIFDSDEEGILLYTFPPSATRDDGTGFLVVSDQRADVTDFEFFDRVTWKHLGTVRVTGVSNTDGIASTQQPMAGYPLGLFAAINNDTTTVGIGWDSLFDAIGWNLTANDARTPYQVWTQSRGLVAGVNDAATDDPDHDGHNNGEEFAFGGEPLDPGVHGPTALSIDTENGRTALLYTFPVRNHAVFTGAAALQTSIDGLVYFLQTSPDLTTFAGAIVELRPARIGALPLLHQGWTYRSFRATPPPTAPSSAFLIRSITVPSL